MPSHKPSKDNTQYPPPNTPNLGDAMLFYAGSTVSVLLLLPFARGYDYCVPPGMEVMPGHIVRVPFGKRTVHGVIWGLEPLTLRLIRSNPFLKSLPIFLSFH